MDDYSMTCSASGLSIEGGMQVRCLLLTKSPYGNAARDGDWLIRTPPIRAVYSCGSVENVNPDDKPIVDLWLRGLREDLVEGVSVLRDMPFEVLLAAVKAGRVQVRCVTNDDRCMVSMAMVREDVWQALIAFPHSDSVTMACDACGQALWYHDKGHTCAHKGRTLSTTYSHGPVFAAGVPHVVVKRDSDEIVWYGLAAIRHDVWTAWRKIVAHYGERSKPLTYMDQIRSEEDQKFLGHIEAAIVKERTRVATLPKAEAPPRFGDFPIAHRVLDARDPTGRTIESRILVASAPGMIGISEHLSMLLADRAEPAPVILDSVAELAAVKRTLDVVGAPLRPSHVEGPEFVRFHRMLYRLGTLSRTGLRPRPA